MTEPPPIPADQLRTSRQRYERFVDDYRQRRLDDQTDAARGLKRLDAGEEKAAQKEKRRELLREYLKWLWPHRYRVAVVFALAVAGAGIQLVEPLFMRHIVDRILLNPALDTADRLTRLNLVGVTFLSVIILSNLINVLKDVGSSRVDLQACKLEYSIVSPK